MTSKAVKERLRKLREKHGLGEYRKNRKTTVKRKTRKGVLYMARRKAKRTRRSGFLGGASGIMPTVIGVGGYIAYESFISPMIPLNDDFKNIAELGAGIFLSTKGGVLGNVGKTMVILNTYQIMRKYFPMTATTTSGSAVTY